MGKNSQELLELLEWMMPLLNEDTGGVNRRDKPRHLLGIADEPSILGAVRHGIDTLDSCYPTRLSRHGTLLSREGKVHIKVSHLCVVGASLWLMTACTLVSPVFLSSVW